MGIAAGGLGLLFGAANAGMGLLGAQSRSRAQREMDRSMHEEAIGAAVQKYNEGVKESRRHQHTAAQDSYATAASVMERDDLEDTYLALGVSPATLAKVRGDRVNTAIAGSQRVRQGLQNAREAKAEGKRNEEMMITAANRRRSAQNDARKATQRSSFFGTLANSFLPTGKQMWG